MESRIFCINPAFDCVSLEYYFFLTHIQRLTGCYLHLFFY